MESWWTETDGDVLRHLAMNGAMAPHEIARAMGISEGEATAFVCMLAREGKVRIRLVEAVPVESCRVRATAA